MCRQAKKVRRQLVKFVIESYIKAIHKVSHKVVPLYNGFMVLLCNYLCDMGNFL